MHAHVARAACSLVYKIILKDKNCESYAACLCSWPRLPGCLFNFFFKDTQIRKATRHAYARGPGGLVALAVQRDDVTSHTFFSSMPELKK